MSADVKWRFRPPRQPSAGLAGEAAGGFLLQATGVLLFLFIPLVLYLFVRHPEPIAASLAAGVGLMLGHRFLARPYMVRAMPRKCVWCNRVLPAAHDHQLVGDPAERQVGDPPPR